MTLSADDIHAARARIADAVEVTPCRESRTLSAITGATTVLKFENQQFTASFKERGALNRLLQLSDAEKQRGVIAMSAGNHAQGVAYHAQRLGIPATIVMPRATPFIKIEQTSHFGPRVMLEGERLRESEGFARALADKEGLTFLHPYDDEAVIAGQGTIALEMLEARPDIDTLVIPIGGGGLIAGNAIAAKSINPDIDIVGVQTELYPAMYQALRGEEPVSGGSTIAEGIAVGRPGTLTLPIVKDLVAEVMLVGEGNIERAVLMLLEVEKTVVEGAGAAGLAAVLRASKRFAGRTVGLILCGGNIDTRLLSSIVMRGLVREGRLARVMIELSDLPGSLARVAEIIGDQGANIVEVSHERAFTHMPVKSAALIVVMETRNRDHAASVLGVLNDAGFPSTEIEHPDPAE